MGSTGLKTVDLKLVKIPSFQTMTNQKKGQFQTTNAAGMGLTECHLRQTDKFAAKTEPLNQLKGVKYFFTVFINE